MLNLRRRCGREGRHAGLLGGGFPYQPGDGRRDPGLDGTAVGPAPADSESFGLCRAGRPMGGAGPGLALALRPGRPAAAALPHGAGCVALARDKGVSGHACGVLGPDMGRGRRGHGIRVCAGDFGGNQPMAAECWRRSGGIGFRRLGLGPPEEARPGRLPSAPDLAGDSADRACGYRQYGGGAL